MPKWRDPYEAYYDDEVHITKCACDGCRYRAEHPYTPQPPSEAYLSAIRDLKTLRLEIKAVKNRGNAQADEIRQLRTENTQLKAARMESKYRTQQVAKSLTTDVLRQFEEAYRASPYHPTRFHEYPVTDLTKSPPEIHMPVVPKKEDNVETVFCDICGKDIIGPVYFRGDSGEVMVCKTCYLHTEPSRQPQSLSGRPRRAYVKNLVIPGVLTFGGVALSYFIEGWPLGDAAAIFSGVFGAGWLVIRNIDHLGTDGL